MDNNHTTPPKGNPLARNVDPVRNQRGMEGHVLAAEAVAKLVAVVITSIGFFIWGQDVAAQYTSNEWAHLATGAIFAAIAAWITDFAFSHFLENAMFQFINFWSFNWWGNVQRDGIYITLFLKPLRWAVVTGIVAALFWADWNSVVTLRSPIADAKQEKAARVDFNALNAAQAEALQAQIGPIDAEIKAVRNRIAATERKTAEANVGLKKLIDDGNAWASAEMAKRKDKATRSDRRQLEKLEAARLKAYEQATTAQAEQRQIAVADDKQAIQSETESKAAIATLFTMFGLGAKILTICFRLFLVINFLIQRPGDVNGDGSVDGADVTAHARNSRNNTGTSGTTTQQHAAPAFAQHGQRIGFKHYDEPPVHQPESRTHFQFGAPASFRASENPPYSVVEQRSTEATEHAEQPAYNGPAHVVADVKEWMKRAQQCYTRSTTSKSEDARKDNWDRYLAFRAMLETVGADVYEDPDGTLRYKVPARYDLNESTAAALRQLAIELDNITNRRRRAMV